MQNLPSGKKFYSGIPFLVIQSNFRVLKFKDALAVIMQLNQIHLTLSIQLRI